MRITIDPRAEPVRQCVAGDEEGSRKREQHRRISSLARSRPPIADISQTPATRSATPAIACGARCSEKMTVITTDAISGAAPRAIG